MPETQEFAVYVQHDYAELVDFFTNRDEAWSCAQTIGYKEGLNAWVEEV